MEKIINAMDNLDKIIMENTFETLLYKYANFPKSLKISKAKHTYENIVENLGLSLTEDNQVFYTDSINPNCFFELFKTIEGYQLYISHYHFDREKNNNIFDFTETFKFKKVSELTDLKDYVHGNIRELVSSITVENSRSLACRITYLYTLLQDVEDFKIKYLS